LLQRKKKLERSRGIDRSYATRLFAEFMKNEGRKTLGSPGVMENRAKKRWEKNGHKGVTVLTLERECYGQSTVSRWSRKKGNHANARRCTGHLILHKGKILPGKGRGEARGESALKKGWQHRNFRKGDSEESVNRKPRTHL